MKDTGSLCQGGHLRFGEWTGNGYDPLKDSFEGVYAHYFAKYIEEMGRYGIPIWAVTVQNEPSNAAPWPAMLWTLQEQADFAHRFLRPVLDQTFPQTRIFINDDSPHCLVRPVREDVTPEQAASIDGLTIHTYSIPYDKFFNATHAYPHWLFGMTERRCMIDETPEDAAHIMSGVIGNWMVRQGGSFIALWNMALDERGLPNMVGATGRRGVVTIDHTSGKVKRNLEYYMLRAFGQDVEPGSTIINPSNYTPDGWSGGLGSVGFLAPDGSVSAHIYNPTGKPIQVAVALAGAGASWQLVEVPAWGTVTMHKSREEVSRSQPRSDEEFELNPAPTDLVDDLAPGKSH
ncbi:hypothetical protein KIMH_13030 [Bombiscardovia apis]|uniref:Glycosyl hydrolase family 30 TIM-barrel domain-containing protein n=1 Tax=Bombiscardovia apis TaxID=2932182 RepID=A0ABM8BE30_9BIFI|nr:hypothetical protein KIMH_13030 [Bombiscardovia apis]